MTKEKKMWTMNMIRIIFSTTKVIGWLGLAIVVLIALKNMGVEVPGEDTLFYATIFLASDAMALVGTYVSMKAEDSIHRLSFKP